MKPEKLKRVVIKEELVGLTKDYKLAIVLQQMLYWSERVRDFDKFLIEEKERQKKNGEKTKDDLNNGWIYKSSEQLSEETMLGISPSNMRKQLKELVKRGFLKERNNPKYKWDRTIQYRVEVLFINKELNKIGYTLEGYAFSKTENGTDILENGTDKKSNGSEQNRKAIPEITTETTSDITNKDIVELFFEESWKLYPNKKGKGKISNSKKKEIYKLKDEFKRCINRYIKYVDNERLKGFTGLKFQNGSTFFNDGYIDYLDENYRGEKNENNRGNDKRNNGTKFTEEDIKKTGIKSF